MTRTDVSLQFGCLVGVGFDDIVTNNMPSLFRLASLSLPPFCSLFSLLCHFRSCLTPFCLYHFLYILFPVMDMNTHSLVYLYLDRPFSVVASGFVFPLLVVDGFWSCFLAFFNSFVILFCVFFSEFYLDFYATQFF